MNTRNYVLAVVFSFLVSSIFSQKNTIRCGVDKLSAKEEKAFKQGIFNFNKQKSKILTKNRNGGPYVIPVVFHILHNGEGSVSKSDMKCRIDDVMLTVNGDFKGTFPGYTSIDPRFEDVKDKMDIQFILATEDPDGKLMEVPGMDWHAEEASISYGYNPKIYDYMWWGKNNKYYVDIVVVDAPNDRGKTNGSGHAFLPVQNVVPHITYNWRYIGKTCGSFASDGFEKVMTHEFGHYFGLRHTFRGECSADNDGIDDTPPTTGSEGCARDVLNSCGVYANLENHMDYNTSCQNMYTKDQVALMTYWLDDVSEAPYPRSLLWGQDNLKETGVVMAVPEACFKSSQTAICIGKTVQFTDTSSGLSLSRSWTFEGGTPAISTEANPNVQYETEGLYKVTLQVSNNLGQNTVEKVAYIEVGPKAANAVYENFEGDFPPAGWGIENPDDLITWTKRADVGNGDDASMVINNANNTTVGEKDYIVLPPYDFSTASKSEMYFDLAYTKFDNDSPDILSIQVSIDCGATWSDVYSKTHTDLETVEVAGESSNNWEPSREEHWRKEIVSLSAYDGNSNVLIRFFNTSGYGTRIWIDNVNISLANDIQPVSDFYSAQRSTVCNSIDIAFKDVSTGNPTVWLWTFEGGVPATSTAQNPSAITYDTPGVYKVTLETSNENGSDAIVKDGYITVVTPSGASFVEDFAGSFPPAGWEISNPDYGLEWEKNTAAGNGDNSCMIMNNSDNDIVGAIDEIILQPLDLSVGTTDFSFDVAYTKFDNDSADELKVLVSKDCGKNWVEVYSKTHTELETFGPAEDPNAWMPTEDFHWRTERILLSEFEGASNVLIKFKNISGYGTRVWIDNINFALDSQEVPFSEFSIKTDATCSNVAVVFSDLSTGGPTSWEWSFPGGVPSTSTEQHPSVLYETPGVYTVQLVASNEQGDGSAMIKNDFIIIDATAVLPLKENFQGEFPVQGWTIINPDNDEIFWEKRTDVGNGDSSCLVINNADNPENKIDELVLQPLDFKATTPEFMKFDIAYTKYDNAEVDGVEESKDQLEVLISSDCGANWSSVYNKGYIDLATVQVVDDPATVGVNETNDWIPTEVSDWREEVIDLTSFSGQRNVLIKFKNTSGFGTRIWIDNLNIAGNEVLGVSDLQEDNTRVVSVYPNPFQETTTIDLRQLEGEEILVTVCDIHGKVLLQQKYVGSTRAISLGKELRTSGSYFVKITTSLTTKIVHLIKQ